MRRQARGQALLLLGQELVQEGDPARLAAQRAVAQPLEQGPAAGGPGREVGHDAAPGALHALRQAAHQVRADGLQRGEVGHLERPQAVGQLELAARHEPVGEVVALGVVAQGGDRDALEALHELAHVGGPGHLAAVGQAEDERAEAQVVGQEAAQRLHQRRGVLGHELHPQLVRLPGEIALGRLQQHRQVRAAGAEAAHQLQARLGIERVGAGEAGVADDPDHVVLVALEERQGRLEVLGVQDLRPGAGLGRALQAVQALGHERLRLLQELRVELRQEGGVVADGVLDHQDGAHPGRADVALGVGLVLDRLGDGQQDARVAVPHEHAVQAARPDLALQVGQIGALEAQHHHPLPGDPALDLLAEGDHLAAGLAGHHQHQVEGPLGQQLQGLLLVGDVGEAGRAGERQRHVLLEHLLGDVAVLLEHEGVEARGDQQDLPHAEGHQVALPPEAGGRARVRHAAPPRACYPRTRMDSTLTVYWG